MNYNSEIYITRVNFDKDYKHCVDFFRSGSTTQARKNAQFNTLSKNAVNHLTDYSPIFESDGTGSIQVHGSHDNWVGYNYLIIKNSEFSNRIWYCFLDSVEYSAPNTSIIYFTVDVWQTFHLDTAFFDSWIDRAHMSKADDILGENLESEPFSVQPIVTRDAFPGGVFTPEEWNPQWVLHSASKYEGDEYKYTGTGTGGSFGEYGFYIDKLSDIQGYIKNYGRKSPEEIADDVGQASGNHTWQQWVNSLFAGTAGTEVVEAVKSTTSIADLQDHRTELIGLFAIPSWARPSGDTEATNVATNRSQTLALNNSMACGYTPRNKKMLSSVFKSYILYARNGTLVAYKPEAFTGTPSITCSCSPMGTSKYYAFISNYNERDKQFVPIAYRCERRVGYDANTGLNKVLGVLNQGERIIGAGATLAGGIASKNPTAILSGAEGLIGSGVSMIEALGQKEGGFGSNGEILDIIGGRAILRWADVSPSYNECVHIDKFLDAYGYAQNTIGDLYNNCLTRNRYNYVKSSDPNLRVNATENYNIKMKDIFKSGVTIWHNIDYMFDYDTPNV